LGPLFKSKFLGLIFGSILLPILVYFRAFFELFKFRPIFSVLEFFWPQFIIPINEQRFSVTKDLGPIFEFNLGLGPEKKFVTKKNNFLATFVTQFHIDPVKDKGDTF
jgi:hypothetical protein